MNTVNDTENPPVEEFNEWCIVEIMGHQRFAGLVSNQMIGSNSFVRIDVPPMGGNEGYTKMFGGDAIFSITPVSQSVAYRAIPQNSRPITALDYPEQKSLGFESGAAHDDEEDHPF